MSTYIQNFLKFRPLLSELVSRDIMMWGGFKMKYISLINSHSLVMNLRVIKKH